MTMQYINILKSRWFIAGTSIFTAVSSLKVYDSLEIKKNAEAVYNKAKEYGREPIKANESPRKITFIQSTSRDAKNTLSNQVLRKYAIPILSVAGCDYEILKIDKSKDDWRSQIGLWTSEKLAKPDSSHQVVIIDDFTKHDLRSIINEHVDECRNKTSCPFIISRLMEENSEPDRNYLQKISDVSFIQVIFSSCVT